MFGDIAIQLLKLMGHSGTVPGAILAKDIPAALARLKSGVATTGNDLTENTAKEADDGNSNEDVVSLAHRALPLIEFLTAAASAKCDVMWDK
jgi:hypothetical protein